MNVYHVSLSQPEEETLLQMYHFAKKRRLRQRAHMILLSHAGYCQKEIAQIVQTSYPTARRFIHAYAVYGLAALYDEEIPGRCPFLQAWQREQMDEWLSASPRALGYNQSNWTARLMRYRIKKTWGISLSGETVRRWIHRLGYALVRPRHQNQFDEAEKKRAEKDLTDYKRRAEAGKIRLFFLDEIRLTLLATLTRMWVKIGTQGEIRTDDNHDKCVGYTAIDWVSCKTHYRMGFDFNGVEFRRFIAHLQQQYPGETIVIVLDNASIHGYTKERGEVTVRDGLYFYFLPSYTALELNPVEKVFRFFRHRVTHNEYFAALSDLMEAARNFFRYLYVCRKRVASLITG